MLSMTAWLAQGRRELPVISRAGALALLAAVLWAPRIGFGEELTVYAYLNPGSLGPVLDAFEQDTGIAVSVTYMTAAELLERLVNERDTASADVVFTMEAKRLAALSAAEVLAPVDSDVLDAAIPDQYRHPDGLWFGLSKWSRSIFYAKERVEPGKITGYESLADERWRGRICMRTANKVYVQSLVASILAHDGESRARSYATGVVSNFAREPIDLDIEQLRAVADGTCDITVANSYYYQRLSAMQYNPIAPDGGSSVRQLLDSVKPLAVEQSTRGTHMNISGFARTANASNTDAALALMEYVVQPLAQRLYADTSHDFPIVDELRSQLSRDLFGDFQEDQMPIAKLADHYVKAEEITRASGWRWK